MNCPSKLFSVPFQRAGIIWNSIAMGKTGTVRRCPVQARGPEDLWRQVRGCENFWKSKLTHWLIDRLIDWLTHWLIDWWLIDWLTHWLIDCHIMLIWWLNEFPQRTLTFLSSIVVHPSQRWFFTIDKEGFNTNPLIASSAAIILVCTGRVAKWIVCHSSFYFRVGVLRYFEIRSPWWNIDIPLVV